MMLPSTSTSADHPIGHAPQRSGDSGAGDSGGLQRRIGLRSAVLFNMLEMIGVGPFITLPLVIAAAGFRLSVWAWVLGAAIAVADGLVWAELGAAFPRAGGSYAFLREIYGPEGRGQLAELSLCLAGRLHRAAVDRLGLHRSLRISRRLLARPRLRAHRRAARTPLRQLRRRRRLPSRHRAPLSQHQLRRAHGLGALCRRHRRAHRRHRLRIRPRRGHRRLAHAYRAALSAALGPHLGLRCSRRPRPGHASRHLLLLGLLQHLLSRRRSAPARAHHPPRHPALGALCLRVLYCDEPGRAAIAGRRRIARGQSAVLRFQLVADIARSAFGPWAGYTIAALIVWTAFASVFSLQLGYSRVPYAAARDGNYFRFLAARASEARHSPPLARCSGPRGSLLLLLLAHRRSSPCSSSRASCCNFSCSNSASSICACANPISRVPSACRSTRCRRSSPWPASDFSSSTASTPSKSSPSPPPSPLSGTLLYLLRAHRLRQWPFAAAQAANPQP